ncbi:MAG: DUF1573 domain-containing protein [Kiritimatiellae bacterium]|nr:DUF1573 domain-containing protein [Kiritimatiellia bacterium]
MVSTNNINLGKIYNFSASTNCFHFVNSGKTDIAIVNAISTCPCISAEKVQKVIKPGEKHTVKTFFNPCSVFDEFKRSIWLITNDPTQKRILLTVSGEVLPLFEGIPKQGITLQARDTEVSFTNKFTITATTTNYFLGTPTNNNSLIKISSHIEKIKGQLGSKLLTIISQARKATRTTAFVNIPVIGPASVDDIRIKFKFIIGARLRASPTKFIITRMDATLEKKFFISTYASCDEPQKLTWEPQIEGLQIKDESYATKASSLRKAFEGRTLPTPRKRSTRYKCSARISPAALKKLMDMDEPAITFNYPNHKSVKIPLIKIKTNPENPTKAAK